MIYHYSSWLYVLYIVNFEALSSVRAVSLSYLVSVCGW